MMAEGSPQARKIVGVYKELSDDERARMLSEAREMARMDFESFVDGAERKGRMEVRVDVARNAMRMGMDVDAIIKLTGLTRAEVENLRDAE